MISRENPNTASQSFLSPLGVLTVISDGQALTALEWGESPGPDRADALTRQAVAELEAWFAGLRTAFSLPLAPAGTVFQNRVWQAMAAIPYGETRTYGQLARILASGPRAVGGACGRNPLPILLPCHRVIGSDGKLHGYSGFGSLATKAWLLQHEQHHAPESRR